MAAGFTQPQLEHIQQMIVAQVSTLRTDMQNQFTTVNGDIVTSATKLATRIEEVMTYAGGLATTINENREAIANQVIAVDQNAAAHLTALNSASAASIAKLEEAVDAQTTKFGTQKTDIENMSVELEAAKVSMQEKEEAIKTFVVTSESNLAALMAQKELELNRLSTDLKATLVTGSGAKAELLARWREAV